MENFFSGPGLDLSEERPTNWRQCFDISTVEEQYRDYVTELLDKYPKAFSLHSLDLGDFAVEELEMHLAITQPPPRSKIYPIPPPLLGPTRKIIQELCTLGVLEPSIGTYQSSCFLVAKNTKERLAIEEAKAENRFHPENHQWRFIVDFRPLNSVLVETFSGTTAISHIYSMLHNRKLACLVDISSSFYQCRVAKSSQHLLGIGLDGGLGHYTFKRSPMGLQTSPAHLSSVSRYILNPKRVLPNGNTILEPLSTNVGVYVDDWVVVADSKEEMFDTMSKLLARLSDLNFKISIKKAEFFIDITKNKVSLLGEECDSQGRTIANKKCELSEKYPRPETKHQLQKMIGFYTFLSSHIQDHQTIIAPLTDRLSMASGPLKWEPDMEQAYQKLKKVVANNIKLHFQDFSAPIYLQTDSSHVAAGCALLQYYGGEVKIINFHSTKYTKAIREKYSIVAKEAISIALGLEKYKRELESSRQRAVITDSSAVVYILSGARAGNGRLARLALTLQSMPFHLLVKHRAGTDNILPDALSRFFETTQPHLKLKNANAVEREELYMPKFHEGEFVTMEQINSFVNKNNQCIFPFLKNTSDASKAEHFNLVQELYTLDTDIDYAVATDHSIEGQAFAHLIQQPVHHAIHHISMASQEVTWENIIKAQRQDVACLTQIRQAERETSSTSLYRIENGILMRKRYPEKSWKVPNNSLIVLPSTNGQLISHILATLHFGHSGHKKMLAVFRSLYYLSKARKHILEFCKGCHICSLMRLKPAKQNPFNHLAIATRPMEFLDVDFIYLPPYRTFQYILNMQDRYSRKCFAVACPNMSAKTVVKALEGVFCNHGVPSYVCGDNQVSLLRNAEVMSFCSRWHCAIRTGIPFNSKSQSLIETANGALKYMLKALTIQYDTDNWPSLLGLCVYLMNTNPNTGLPSPLSPDAVHFGRDIILFPHMKHKIAGRVLPAEYFEETSNVHEANKKAIAEYHKWRFRNAPRDSQNMGTPYSPGKLVYFRRIQAQTNLKPGTGIKYVNTLYRIEKVFHSLIFLRDIFKVTAPPFTVTTTTHFLKPFSERSPFLFQHLKPDQRKLGGPLQHKDFPPASDEISIVPEVYDPTSPKLPFPPPLPIKKRVKKESEQSFSSAPESDELESETEADSEPNPHNDAVPNASPKGDNAFSSSPKLPAIATTPSDKPIHPGGKNLTSWLKQALTLPGRQTRSGRKLEK